MPEDLKLLNKQEILAADDMEYRTVPVPEWDGAVMIRSLMGYERDEFEIGQLVGKGRDREVNLRNLRQRLVGLSIVDPDSSADPKARLFADTEIKAISRKNARAIQRIFVACQEISGLTDEAVEELVGNSEDDQSDDSGSDSQDIYTDQ